MKFYSFNICDFISSTFHLTNDEELAYRRAIDWYYDNEKKIPLDMQWISKRLRVNENVLQIILNEFFTMEYDGWSHKRCDKEIATYYDILEKNRLNGKKGGRPKSVKNDEKKPLDNRPVSDRLATGNQPVLKQEKHTINDDFEHKNINKINELHSLEENLEKISCEDEYMCYPEYIFNKEYNVVNKELYINNIFKEKEKKYQKKKKKDDEVFDGINFLAEHGVDVKLATDWIKTRKAKKLVSTETAFKGFLNQAKKAGLSPSDAVQMCVVRGWGGLNAEWLNKKQHSFQTFESHKDRCRRETIEGLTGKKLNNQNIDIIDIN